MGQAVSGRLSRLRGNEFYWFVLAVVVFATPASWFDRSCQTCKATEPIAAIGEKMDAGNFPTSRRSVP